MNKKCKNLIICMVFVSGNCFSQYEGKLLGNIKYSGPENKSLNYLQLIAGKKVTANKKISTPFLSANFYAQRLGFFCKQEIKFDKITTIPFRFRLGSVEQCNWLEGKTRPF